MERAKENPLAWQSVMTKDPGPFTLARGGVPLINNGEVISAVAVSGAVAATSRSSVRKRQNPHLHRLRASSFK